MAAEELGGDREFRYPLRTGRLLGFGLLAVLGLIPVVFGLVGTVVGLLQPSGGGGGWQLLGVAATFSVFVIAGVWTVRHDVLLSRGCVQVTRVGLTMTDWRGRDERLFWDEVALLHAGHATIGSGPLGVVAGAALVVCGAGRVLRISAGLDEPDELRESIVERAGLTLAGRVGNVERYVRPRA